MKGTNEQSKWFILKTSFFVSHLIQLYSFESVFNLSLLVHTYCNNTISDEKNSNTAEDPWHPPCMRMGQKTNPRAPTRLKRSTSCSTSDQSVAKSLLLTDESNVMSLIPQAIPSERVSHEVVKVWVLVCRALQSFDGSNYGPRGGLSIARDMRCDAVRLHVAHAI